MEGRSLVFAPDPFGNLVCAWPRHDGRLRTGNGRTILGRLIRPGFRDPGGLRLDARDSRSQKVPENPRAASTDSGKRASARPRTGGRNRSRLPMRSTLFRAAILDGQESEVPEVQDGLQGRSTPVTRLCGAFRRSICPAARASFSGACPVLPRHPGGVDQTDRKLTHYLPPRGRQPKMTPEGWSCGQHWTNQWDRT